VVSVVLDVSVMSVMSVVTPVVICLMVATMGDVVAVIDVGG